MNVQEHLHMIIAAQVEFVAGAAELRARAVAAPSSTRELVELAQQCEYAAVEILANLRMLAGELAGDASTRAQCDAVREELATPDAFLR